MVKPGKYVWHNKDYDQIVEVEGVLGEGPDGKIYLKIKDSAAGVPLDQCTLVRMEVEGVLEEGPDGEIYLKIKESAAGVPVKNVSKSTKPANSRLF